MQLFYTCEVNGGTCLLDEEESWHCTRVLRLREGDTVKVTDGQGKWYEGILSGVQGKRCLVSINRVTSSEQRRPWWLHVAIAPTKNIERFEWFLEKATEIGIDEVTPLICEHSERKVVKMPRLTKVLTVAMKQSLKPWLPLLHEPADFGDFISRPFTGQKFIGWCETGRESEFQNLYHRGSNALVLIGPEGDYSRGETELAVKSGYTPVSLGDSRLRTETAGIVVCQIMEIMNKLAR